MAAEANKARNNPALLAAFKRLHLGIRTKQTTAFIDVREWKLNAGQTIRESDLDGRIAYGGLDLASVSDLTALCWLFPFDDGPGYDAIWRFWTPEDNLEALDKRTADAASKLWVPQGWLLTTPGNVTDYEFIKAQILADAEQFDVQSIGFDRWNSSHLVNELMDEGIPVVKVGQGYLSMSPALKEVQRLVKMGAGGAAADRRPRLRHGGNPVALWNVDNLAVDMDPAGNVKPSKATSADKIDGVSALCDAMSEALAAPELTKSAYELHGVRAV
jgi:phage terminase large subunit-like protein